jgi:quinoprotein glucose dehydrogenase
MLKMNPTHKNRIPIIFSWFLVYLFFGFGCSDNRNQISVDSETAWPVYLGDNASSQYSPLDQINTENVHLLEPVWEYKTEKLKKDDRTQIQCNPLIIDGILYGTSPKLRVFALNAATGKRIWEFNPSQEINFAMNVNRGVTWWSEGSDKRIFFTAGAVLYALNAETGKLVSSFGQQGKVSLKEGLGENAADRYVVATSPGIVYNDLIILGSRVSENVDAAPGHIRAYHVKTGKLEWVFHTIPQPGEFGYETWPEDAWQYVGGANNWAGMSLDEERGIVFIPTGSAAFDFWGGNRKGQNLFANCVLALNAATGERIWHFQTVYHDIWDRDLPAPPNLVTVTHNGKKIDAVAQITKSGFVFLLHRETGEPLFPVEERPVPPSDLKGEETWPVQPFP